MSRWEFPIDPPCSPQTQTCKMMAGGAALTWRRFWIFVLKLLEDELKVHDWMGWWTWICASSMFMSPVCESHVLKFCEDELNVTWCRIGWVGKLVLPAHCLWVQEYEESPQQAEPPDLQLLGTVIIIIVNLNYRNHLWCSMFVHEHHHCHHSQHLSSW